MPMPPQGPPQGPPGQGGNVDIEQLLSTLPPGLREIVMEVYGQQLGRGGNGFPQPGAPQMPQSPQQQSGPAQNPLVASAPPQRSK